MVLGGWEDINNKTIQNNHAVEGGLYDLGTWLWSGKLIQQEMTHSSILFKNSNVNIVASNISAKLQVSRCSL